MGKEDINEIIKAGRLKAVADFEDDLKESEESPTLKIESNPDGNNSDAKKPPTLTIEKNPSTTADIKKPPEDLEFKNQTFKKIKEEKEIVKIIAEIYDKSKSKKVKEVGQETFVENTVNRFAHYPEGKTKDGIKYPAAAEIVKSIAIKIKSDEKYQLEEETIEKLKFYAERAAKAERGDIISGKKSKLKEPVTPIITPEEPPVVGEPITPEEPPVAGEPAAAKTSSEQLMT